MGSFHFCWAASLLVLLLLAGWTGWATRKSGVGILIDTRGRYSLNHLQIVMWTLLILSAIMGVFLARLFGAETNLLAFKIPQQLLTLMGISVGSATIAGAAKSAKDVPGSGARVARAGTFTMSDGSTRPISPGFAQVFQEEQGDQADKVVDVTKFQNFVLTLLAGVAFIAWTWNQTTLEGLPEPSKQILWLLGISHAGYIGGKLPTK